MYSTDNEQLVLESKIIKANNKNDLIDRVNDYVNNRPARFGEIEEIDDFFCMQVDILCQPITTIIRYEPVKTVPVYPQPVPVWPQPAPYQPWITWCGTNSNSYEDKADIQVTYSNGVNWS